jgi:polyisoprenyl-teichoic acid--peptidoglycan teichoic acid transferase
MTRKPMQSAQKPIKNKASAIKLLTFIFVIALAAILVAIIAFRQSESFFASYNVTNLEGIAIANTPVPAVDEQGQPLPDQGAPQTSPNRPAIEGPAAQPWDGASQVTVLVMGLDYGDWSEDRDGPSRTDTMILLTMDPLTLTAGVLNIPRDLWVNIPGFGYGRINTAYYLGEANQLPDGGPGLAIKAVESLLGVPINYYAQIDFKAFETFIDIIGGVVVNVDQELKIDPIGKDNTIILTPGEHRLYGPEALAYARARYTEGGDFDRAQRQQEVLLEIRRRVFKPEVFPVLLARAPEIYKELSSGIHTNMSFEEAIQLGMVARDVAREDIRMSAIAPPDQVLFAKSPDGTQDILKPIPDKIRETRDYVFGAAIQPGAQGESSEDLMRQENARISVLNGTWVEGLAGTTQQYLNTQGANVIQVSNAADSPQFCLIYDYTGNPYTVKYLVEMMAIPPNNIISSYNPASEIDVEVILGASWANANPMP